MENLIPIINQLQDVLATVKSADSIQLPQIVVVGNQSSGKSSVLEAIIGMECLPRGTGIVTRAPLILQLENIKKELKPTKVEPTNVAAHLTDKAIAWKQNLFERVLDSSFNAWMPGQSEGTADDLEYAEFLHKKGEKFTDMAAVRAEIEDETNRRTGGTKRICSEPIRLKIYSTKVTDLTLVDLPGMTKVPIGGQPEDIEQQVRKLIIDHIKNPNSIILAVTAANTDPATSEAIKLAKAHDPEGKRTLAVLTKLDLMDRGTDARDVLQGRVIPVKLGIIGLVNRSQEDINNNKSIEDARQYELSFLIKNYPGLDEQNGSAYLIKRLSEILMRHIAMCLPDLRKRVFKLIGEYRDKLKSYGETLEKNQKGPKLLQIVKEFVTSFEATIEGTVSIEKTKLCGGAKICDLLVDRLGHELDAINALDGLKDREIYFSIKNATGLVPALNVPQRAFELLVKEQLKKLEEPCLVCADWILEEMDSILEHCQTKMEHQVSHYPNLNREMLEIAKGLLAKKLPKTKAVIGEILSAQLEYINVKNEQFEAEYIRQMIAIEQANQQSASATKGHSSMDLLNSLANLSLADASAATENKHCQIVKQLVKAYFGVVKNQMKDLVAKIVVRNLVNSFINELQEKLTDRLHREDQFDKLFFESADLSVQRKATADMLEALERGLKVIGKVNKGN